MGGRENILGWNDEVNKPLLPTNQPESLQELQIRIKYGPFLRAPVDVRRPATAAAAAVHANRDRTHERVRSGPMFRSSQNSSFFTLFPSHQFLAACMEY
jgi:hypothetical protein